MRRSVIRSVFLLLGLLDGVAEAATLADCRRLEEASARLACYDALPLNEAPALPVAATVSPAAVPVRAGVPASLLGKAWELDDEYRSHILQLRPYKPVYALPLFHSTNPNTNPASPSPAHQSATPLALDRNEGKFQISLKSKLYEDLFGNNGDLWFGYTQSSRWQVYNGDQSRPFRETNYEPEATLVWRTDYDIAGWRGRMLSLGINHQSNGRSLPYSRSWNRVIAAAAFEKDNWTLTVRPWWRIPEGAGQDDNPDIGNYLGRADVQLIRISPGGHQMSLLLRHSLRVGSDSRGAMQLDYAFPIAGDLRGHLQWFSGYGESMIDYNHRANYYGIGLSMLEWY